MFPFLFGVHVYVLLVVLQRVASFSYFDLFPTWIDLGVLTFVVVRGVRDVVVFGSDWNISWLFYGAVDDEKVDCFWLGWGAVLR